uniref:Sulfotransferase domain-containing protein n=1 Tax=Rhizochromulina marina TaxID=1034831 RepID=A0A7S2R4X3_9STRA|mmetsp:Transcript_10819/g.30997  ORF Transcript_10819/g.30997 Transcript_10819/m.30997 type:complete len:290 (+) Transcript_10819:92-961(+)
MMAPMTGHRASLLSGVVALGFLVSSLVVFPGPTGPRHHRQRSPTTSETGAGRRRPTANSSLGGGQITRYSKVSLQDLLANHPGIKKRGVFVLGCGHSGTSTVAKAMWNTVGLRLVNPFRQLAEDRDLVRMNNCIVRTYDMHGSNRTWDSAADIESFLATEPFADPRKCRSSAVGSRPLAAPAWIRNYPRPFVLKDPRLVWTLHLWTGMLQQANVPLPVLIHVYRNSEAILASHRKRGETVPLTGVKSRLAWSQWQLEHWPGEAISLDISAAKGGFQIANHIEGKKGRRG